MAKKFNVRQQVLMLRMLAYMESKLEKRERNKEYEYLFLQDNVSKEDFKELSEIVMTLEK